MGVIEFPPRLYDSPPIGNPYALQHLHSTQGNAVFLHAIHCRRALSDEGMEAQWVKDAARWEFGLSLFPHT